MEKKSKKNKKIIFSAFILILLITITISIDIYLNIGNGEHVKAIKKYMSYIEKSDYDSMYDMISDESKAKISKEDFVSRNKNIYEGIELKKLDISNITVNSDKTSVTYTTTMQTLAGKIEFSNNASIEKIDDKCKIKWNSNLIFPELNDDYKVRVATYKAKRGNILDRNGEILAGEGKAASVGIVPGKMSENKQKDISTIANLLGIEEEFISKQLSQGYVKEGTFVPLKTIEKNNKELKEKLLQIKGIMITDKDARIYPLGEATSQMLGYVQNISAEELENNKEKDYTSTSLIGKTGLEKIYEEILHGADGCEVYIVDDKENKVKTLVQKLQKDGKDVKLTIDSRIQKFIYEEFKNDKSATVAMNPKTGEILALVSTPTFNSNDFSIGMSSEKWQALNNDEKKPLINRYLARYAPGSSLKPIIGAIGLSLRKDYI